MTNTKELYKVAYRPVGKGTQNAIVRATSREEAQKQFNDPSDFTLNHEIKKVTKSMTIPAGWVVSTSETGFERFTVKEAVMLNKVTTVYAYSLVNGEKRKLSVDAIMSAVPPSRDKGIVRRGY